MIVFSQLSLVAKKTPINLEKALNKGLIVISAKGKGGLSILMNLRNKYKDTLILLIEAGRKFNSLNDNEQDILVTKEQLVQLKGLESKTITVFGFCCQASKGSPSVDSKYSAGKMANSSLVALANYCNKNNFDRGDIQSSVWCLSDKHSLSSISTKNMNLRNFIKKLTNQENTWYQKEYAQNTSTMAFTDMVTNIKGDIKYTTIENGIMTFEIMKSNGEMVRRYTNKKPVQKGTYDYKFNLQVNNWSKGKYIIHIYSDDQLQSKKEFEI